MFFLERRRIERRIRQLNKRLYEWDQPPTPKELKTIEAELRPLEDQFGLIETGRLERKANPLSIEIPNENERESPLDRNDVKLSMDKTSE